MSSDSSRPTSRSQSPFFHATQAGRYDRQERIQLYEQATERSLVVFHGRIERRVITPFADAVGEVSRDGPLDLMLTSPGGDGETAKQMATMCRADRDDFRSDSSRDSQFSCNFASACG